MRKTLLQFLKQANTERRRLIGVLLDPEKFDPFVASVEPLLPENQTDVILLVGGSTRDQLPMSAWLCQLKTQTKCPIFLFPGDVNQLSDQADALLFLQLLSGDNPEYLIGQHEKAVPILEKMTIEIIPTAYLLIDGGTVTTVAQITATKPLNQQNVDLISRRAKAAEWLGHQLVYLEAGSGAKKAVSPEIVQQVANRCSIPILVGGGIRSAELMEQLWEAGATVVVLGTILEQQPHFFSTVNGTKTCLQ